MKDKPDEQKRLTEKFVEASIQGRPPTVHKWKQEVDAIAKPKGEPSRPVVSRDITYECPYCGAAYHPYYQGEEDEPHRHGLKRVYRAPTPVRVALSVSSPTPGKLTLTEMT